MRRFIERAIFSLAVVVGASATASAQQATTKPDFVVYVPKVSDTGDEHFLAFDGPDGSLMAV